MWFGSLSKTYSEFPDMRKKENNLISYLNNISDEEKENYNHNKTPLHT